MTLSERIQALNKYEWVFNQYLRSSECRMGSFAEIQELAEHHKELFGEYPNIMCGACKAEMMQRLGEWYFKSKNDMTNGNN